MLFVAISPVAFAGKISGMVKLPAGEIIPPGASVQVELREISKADAGLVGKCDVRDGGGKNDAAFEISFDDNKISPANSYSVSCRIVAKGKLLFINDAHVAVLTHDAPKKDIALPVSKVKK
jgi:uncharacterized lipoprotein YbaY